MDNKFSNRTTNHTGDVHFEIVSVVLGHRAAAGPLATGVPGGHRGRLPSAGVLQVRQLRPGVERRGADPPADLSVGDPEDQGLRVKVGRPEGQQVFERRTSGRAPLAPEAWKVTSSHRRSAASERRSSPSRSTAQIATSTRPRLSAAWGVPRASAFSGFAWRCGWVSALASPAKASLTPPRRWASEIPARALGDLRQEELRVHCTCRSGVRAEVEGQGQDGGVVIGHGSHLLP